MPTKIPWAHETVCFSTGCSGPTGTPESPRPCSWCYARRMANRLSAMPQSAHKYRNRFRPTFHPEEIEKFRKKAKRWRKAKRIFVNSMSDVMDPGFTDLQIQLVIDVARELDRHTFMFLSKRPERYRHFAWPDNAWLGASATNQEQADAAMRAFSYFIGPRVTFLSCEPLLGLIWLRGHVPSWVIIGSMTGPKAQPPDRNWVIDLTGQAKTGNAAIFHKPNLEKHFGDTFTRREFPG